MGVTLKSSKASNALPPEAAGLFAHQEAIRSFNRIRGLDPTSVIQPPMTAQNPMGMRIRDTGTFNWRQILLAAGRNRAAAPMFCIKLEMNATVPEIRVMILTWLFPASRMIWREKVFITPVLSRPSPMMMTAMIETTALELNPLMASDASITPDSGNSTIIKRPTMSTLTTSKTNRRVTKIKNPNTMIISGVISRGEIIFASISYFLIHFSICMKDCAGCQAS